MLSTRNDRTTGLFGCSAALAGVLLLVVVSLVFAQEPTQLPLLHDMLTPAELAWLAEHPTITVVQDPGWPPIEFTDERGEPSGMTQDYLQLLEQRLGVKFITVKGLNWQEAFQKLKSWEIDLTPSVAATADREFFWAFTKPYMEIPIVMVTKTDVAYIRDMSELEGKRVAVVENYAAHDWIPKDYPDIDLVPVPDVQEGLQRVQRGDVFAYIENMLVVGHYLTKLQLSTTLKIAGTTPYVNAQSMAVRKDWAILAGILDKALTSIGQDERDAIYRRWLPVRYEYGVDYTFMWHAAAAVALVLVALAFWIWVLKREIERRKVAEDENHRLLEEAEASRLKILQALESQQKTRESLAASNATLHAAIDNMTDAVFVSDTDANFVLFNQAFITYHRFADEAECKKNLAEYPAIFEVYLPDGTLTQLDQWAVPRALAGESVTHAEYRLRRKDTGESWIGSYSFSPIRNQHQAIVGSVVVCRDITESKKATERLRYQHDHDYLTGLYNRGYLERALERLDGPKHLPVSIIIADTNGLKLVNDSFGHEAGDQMLRRTAELLTTIARNGDIVARYGGDEFVLLLPHTDRAESERIVQEIESLTKEVRIDSFQLSISFGYQTRTGMDDDFASVFQRAEDMMYRHKLYESSSAKNKAIGLVINSLFAKSDRESQHSKRVSELSEAIAIKMGFPSAEVNRIRVAGLMHDIGKIGIPEHILNKTSALTAQEWEEIRRHPETGSRILATASEFIDISTIILEHHERWDGLGYPRGLAGEAISIQARIIHVADAFDAMTSERSYKRPMEITAAMEEILACAGTHFDPKVVQFFERAWHQL